MTGVQTLALPIFKGPGGVLDRFDGFLLPLPAVYYLPVALQPWVTR